MIDHSAHLLAPPHTQRGNAYRKLRFTAGLMRGLLIGYVAYGFFRFVPWWLTKQGINDEQLWLGLGINLMSWLCLVCAVMCAFRFLNRFFKHQTFSFEGGQALKQCAWFAIASQTTNMLARPITHVILNPDAPIDWSQLAWGFTPRDPVATLFCLALLMFAFVHQWTLDIVQEHAEFV